MIDIVPIRKRGESINLIRPEGDKAIYKRPEQKCLPLLREIIFRYSRPGDIAVDLFRGTFSGAVANITILNKKMRTLVGTELDEK